MIISPHSRYRLLSLWVVVLLGTSSIAVAQTHPRCAPTPAEAAGSVAPPVVEPPRIEMGYRLIAVHWDPLLKQRWATVVNCRHPELPTFAVLVTGRGNEFASPFPKQKGSDVASSPVIRIGDQVHLWAADHDLRIDTFGIAESGGSEGDLVRIRLPHASLDDQQPQHIVNGVVRGPREVEMQR